MVAYPVVVNMLFFDVLWAAARWALGFCLLSGRPS